MNKEKIILIGGGDFAKKIIRLITKIGLYEILGYTDIIDQGDLFNVKYLGDDIILEKLIKKHPNCCAVICMAGNLDFINLKQNLVSKLHKLGFRFPKLISPSAYIDESAIIEEGCIVFDKVYVDFGVSINAYSILNLCSTICHDTKIGKFTTISPEATTGGGSTIGDNTFIGMNATIRPYTSIASNSIIGFGAVVTKDCLESGTYIGNPAKIR